MNSYDPEAPRPPAIKRKSRKSGKRKIPPQVTSMSTLTPFIPPGLRDLVERSEKLRITEPDLLTARVRFYPPKRRWQISDGVGILGYFQNGWMVDVIFKDGYAHGRLRQHKPKTVPDPLRAIPLDFGRFKSAAYLILSANGKATALAFKLK